MRPDRPPLQSVTETAVSTLAALVQRLLDGVVTTYRFLRRLLHRFRRRSRELWNRGRRHGGELLSGPVKRFVTGPLRAVLLGRRTDLSLIAVLASPALALAVAWWVGSTLGYESVVASVRGTWFGTDPSLSVFGAVGVLLLLAAVSAAANSGLLPTTLLVIAPIFGAAATRYGTTVTYTWGAEVVSLPSAVWTAAGLALAFGVPIAAAGFLLGSFARRTGTTLRSRVAVGD
jgi:hypothetical protein